MARRPDALGDVAHLLAKGKPRLVAWIRAREQDRDLLRKVKELRRRQSPGVELCAPISLLGELPFVSELESPPAILFLGSPSTFALELAQVPLLIIAPPLLCGVVL